MGEFSLLSLNTFGIPFYLGWERMARLARELDRAPVEVICLQEVQQNAYSHLIQRSLASYPHAVFERHQYAPKGGLAVFSRLPLEQHRFDVYQDRGAWHSISFADWALFKGILMVNLESDTLPVIILNTHMNANYAGVWHPANRMSRTLHHQILQVNEMITLLPKEALIITCGDLNFPRTSYLYEELVGPHNLLDPLAEDERHTYRPFPLVPAKWKTSLDYILVRPSNQAKMEIRADVFAIEDSTKRHPIQRFLTDHNALTLHVKWEPAHPLNQDDDSRNVPG
jgi:endonuclease/exonuclease/phosphatase family metal-dependent hydrolase